MAGYLRLRVAKPYRIRKMSGSIRDRGSAFLVSGRIALPTRNVQRSVSGEREIWPFSMGKGGHQ